jgi:hypothetical protein
LAVFANDHDPVATFHTLPLAARDAAPDPLTPARHRLRQAIAAVDRARRETEAAAEQIHRLTAVVAEHDRLQAQMRELYTRDQAARGEWIAGGRIRADPGNAADTRSQNDRIVAMGDELAAAKATLPEKEEAHRAAVSRLQTAQAERGSAIAEVAIEVCAELAGELTGHLNTALAVEAQIRSVLEALSQRADRGEPGIASATERLVSIIRQARERAGVPRDTQSGPRLLDALAGDPEATLP